MNTALSTTLLSLLALGLFCAPVSAQEDTTNAPETSLKAVMDKARDAYNGERYKEAIALYTSAAQIDPGGRIRLRCRSLA